MAVDHTQLVKSRKRSKTALFKYYFPSFWKIRLINGILSTWWKLLRILDLTKVRFQRQEEKVHFYFYICRKLDEFLKTQKCLNDKHKLELQNRF